MDMHWTLKIFPHCPDSVHVWTETAEFIWTLYRQPLSKLSVWSWGERVWMLQVMVWKIQHKQVGASMMSWCQHQQSVYCFLVLQKSPNTCGDINTGTDIITEHSALYPVIPFIVCYESESRIMNFHCEIQMWKEVAWMSWKFWNKSGSPCEKKHHQ